MDPIINLFETEAVRDLVHQSGPYEGDKINVTKLKEVLYPAYSDYCSQMSGVNCHLGCPKLIFLTIIDSGQIIDHNTFQLQDFAYNEHVIYCHDINDAQECLFFSNGELNYLGIFNM